MARLPRLSAALAAASLAATLTAGCGSHAGNQRAFCADLRSLQSTSVSIPKVNAVNAADVLRRYQPVADLMHKAKGDAPKDIRPDVARLATYFGDVVDALDKIDPDHPTAAFDALDAASGQHPAALRSSSRRVQSYATDTCRLPPPSSTTTTSVAPG